MREKLRNPACVLFFLSGFLPTRYGDNRSKALLTFQLLFLFLQRFIGQTAVFVISATEMIHSDPFGRYENRQGGGKTPDLRTM